MPSTPIFSSRLIPPSLSRAIAYQLLPRRAAPSGGGCLVAFGFDGRDQVLRGGVALDYRDTLGTIDLGHCGHTRYGCQRAPHRGLAVFAGHSAYLEFTHVCFSRFDACLASDRIGRAPFSDAAHPASPCSRQHRISEARNGAGTEHRDDTDPAAPQRDESADRDQQRKPFETPGEGGGLAGLGPQHMPGEEQGEIENNTNHGGRDADQRRGEFYEKVVRGLFQNNATELHILVGLGICATVLRFADYPLTPLLIGFVLGGMMENNFAGRGGGRDTRGNLPRFRTALRLG